MYNNAPQTGLASLVASPYADSDVMNVQMTPREVAGLQQLAMSYGAREEDLYDPITGQPKFSFLKKILPMVAGAVLGPAGFGMSAFGAAATVGAVTGLIEGDLKKGLMAGLSAYSGGKISEGLKAAATSATAAPTAAATEVAPTANLPSTSNAPASFISGGTQPVPLQAQGDMSGFVSGGVRPSITQAVQSGTTVKPPPTGFFETMGRGVQNVFASGDTGAQSRSAFMGVFDNPLAKYATLAGGLAAITPEQKPLNVPEQENIMYIPGGFNPQYGTGAGQSYQLPGQYYKRTSKGLVPYNPYAMAPGYAAGGPVQAPDQNMNQQRALPHEYQPLPNPNQNYPLSTVMHANYQANSPQPREVVSGYEVAIDPYNGEERFANGGPVTGGGRGPEDDPTNYPPVGVAPPPGNPYAQSAVQETNRPPPSTTTLQQTATTQQPPIDPNVEANRKYVAELNRRALNPTFTPYGMIAGGGLGGVNAPWTGTNPYGGPLNTTTGGQQTQTGGDSAAQTAAFLATQIGINWMMQPGNALALKNWITGGMKWADRPFLNADKAGTGTGTGTGTGQGQGQTGQGQTQTGGEGQTTTGAEKPPVFDPVKGIVIAGGTSAAAIAAAKALAAKQGIASVGVYALDGTLIANVAGGAGAATGVAGAATGATGATGAATGTTGAATTGATGAGTQTGIASTLKGGATAAGTAAAAAAALIGAHQAYQGISKGREGQAAAGGALAGAGGAYLAGASGLGGAGLTSLAGFGPIGLAAAALAAIGASMVNTKEYGDVALRNYWNAVDKGRGIGQTDPNELAQGFINFYRTNKNEFAGQAKYGRTGNEDFVYDMTQVINNAVKDGKVDKDVDAATMYKQVVQPWLNSMGDGPKDEKARAIQDFMMTDLINSFMQGKAISNAQVKGDKKFKIVSERPVYAGVPTTQQQTPAAEDDSVRQAMEAYGMRGGIPTAVNPFNQVMPFAEGGAIGDDYNFGFATGGMPEYKAGGKLLDGPGDGMSDDIPAVIRGRGVQRAALADGEFVVPADVVSHLGNGSTKAGAKKLYAMMARVRQARTGSKRQAPAVKTDRLLPA